MRRLFFVAIAVFFLAAALIPLNPSAAAVTDGERLAMFSKPSVVRIIDGVAGTFYYAPPNWKSVKTNQLLIQVSQQASEEDRDESTFPWTIVVIVLVVLFLIIAIIVIAVVAFLIMRKRTKGKLPKGGPGTQSAGPGPASSPSGPAPAPGSSWTPQTPPAEARPASSNPSANPGAFPAATPQVPPGIDRSATIDLSQTVAILPQSDTAPINYGSITFISGALAGQKFDVTPEGACIGRDSSSSQIVIADPRISKRHVWVGVRGGRVVIEDQSSRNGTFLNDPKSERITENALSEGDTVILGESDVARFEYRK